MADLDSSPIDFDLANQWASDPLDGPNGCWTDGTKINAAAAYKALIDRNAELVKALQHQRWRTHDFANGCDGCNKCETLLGGPRG